MQLSVLIKHLVCAKTVIGMQQYMCKKSNYVRNRGERCQTFD